MITFDQTSESIQKILRKHWTIPALGTSIGPLKGDALEVMVVSTWNVLMTRQYRVGPLPEPNIQQEIQARLRNFISQGKPITITIGYGPLKNQNAVGYSRTDWAEFFALGHLVSWHNKVQKVYAPGLKFQIIFDDSTLRMANQIPKQLMCSYMRSVKELIDALGYQSVFSKPFAQSRFSWVFHLGMYQLAGWRVRKWERLPEHREQIERMDLAALRNLPHQAYTSEEALHAAARKASHRYRVYWEALQLVGLSKSKKRLIGMYLDGSQHHIKQPIAMHLTTLDKGQMTQPWQGEGALIENGHGQWEPGVLTANRRKKCEIMIIKNIRLLPLIGFDQITLAYDLTRQSRNNDVKEIKPVSVNNLTMV